MNDLDKLRKLKSFIESRDNEDILQGKLILELKDSKKRQRNYLKDMKIYGLNYYNRTKLSELVYEAEKYLGITDLDVDTCLEWLAEMKDNACQLIEYLISVEIKIIEIKEEFEENSMISTDSSIAFITDGGDNNDH